ncbi:MAG: CcmD family protein [Firmicutes bacterium]|nr:CcmD family protein [Bacillota bacterium]
MSYLFAAYTIIWVVIFLYTVYLWRKQNEVATELEILKRAVEDK